jgi:hypothetical protein
MPASRTRCAGAQRPNGFSVSLPAVLTHDDTHDATDAFAREFAEIRKAAGC